MEEQIVDEIERGDFTRANLLSDGKREDLILYAAKNGKSRTVRYLSEKHSSYSNSLLYYACKFGDEDHIRWIINNNDCNLIFGAVGATKNRLFHILDLLDEYGSIDYQTIFIYTCRYSSYSTVLTILDTKDINYHEAIGVSIKEKRYEVTKELNNRLEGKLWIPLYFCMLSDDIETARYIISLGRCSYEDLLKVSEKYGWEEGLIVAKE